MARRCVLRGAGVVVRLVKSLRYRGVHEGPLLTFDLLDILLVGLGCVFVVLVVLRR